jgi:predicted component of type VI protein secretion system
MVTPHNISLKQSLTLQAKQLQQLKEERRLYTEGLCSSQVLHTSRVSARSQKVYMHMRHCLTEVQLPHVELYLCLHNCTGTLTISTA